MNGEELSDRAIERFAYCLLPCAYCLLAVWARAGGDNYGQSVRQKGRGNVRKRGDFRGVWAGKEGSEGRISGLESRKKATFLRTGGVIGGHRGVSRPESGIMSWHTPARNHPPGTEAKGETDARSGRSVVARLHDLAVQIQPHGLFQLLGNRRVVTELEAPQT